MMNSCMLFQVFQQAFTETSTNHDVIVAELANMWIAGAVCLLIIVSPISSKIAFRVNDSLLFQRDIHDLIWLLFTKITIESSSRAYDADAADGVEHRYA